MKLISNLTIWAITITFLACNNVPYKKEAIALNNKAVELMNKNVDSSIFLFDQAIALDTTYHLPIQNKINLLLGTKRHKEALKTTNFLISKSKYPEALETKGMLEELLNEPEEAQKSYLKALEIRLNEIKTVRKDMLAKKNFALGFTYILAGDTLLGKKLIQENFKASGQLPDLKDSIIKYANDRKSLISFTITGKAVKD